MVPFSLHFEHFENWAFFRPLVQILITPSHWKDFGPTKAYNHRSELQILFRFQVLSTDSTWKDFSTIFCKLGHALHCNWLCHSITALWLLLTHCSLCTWKTASLPTENQVPHVNFFGVNNPLTNGCKFFLRHLVTSQKKHQSWKWNIQDWKIRRINSFCSSRNCRFLCFIKTHGVFLHLNVIKMTYKPSNTIDYNKSKKTWTT